MKAIISKHGNSWTGILLNEGKLFNTYYSINNREEAALYFSKIAKKEVEIEERDHPIIDAINGIIDGTSFDLPKIDFDFSGFTDNEISVLKELLNVPAGEVVSYGELAKRVGIPYGARFVGNVMMKNRFGPIVPCHRVILSSGRLGKFAGRSNHPMKRRLLEQENAKFKD
ncbi:MAG: methylated-DNA--[protein]-cysteine S-methyltransferase [Candidatus Heimdallarchaeota archaeon]|nr:methylated-DNA--[protein]-cysteine S-methyltransferase [Candidatus Heimdallarchaeota archaeon]MCK4954228.1 methylated-DNA--[protein]-cysteine S-methyltransferase [Candidatus Heimdallarchaeota archaeon]